MSVLASISKAITLQAGTEQAQPDAPSIAALPWRRRLRVKVSVNLLRLFRRRR